MTFRNKISIFSFVFVFMLSAVMTIPAYADDGLPPVDVPVEALPIEPPTQDPVVVDAVQAQPEVVVVLNEAGEAVPLASQEAANAIVAGDPMWCPVGVTPGGAGCTGTTTSFATMLTNLTGMYTSVGPSKAGVIWIEDSYNSAVNDAAAPGFFILTGSNLTAMKDFALTLQGGWSGTGTTITPGGVSYFTGDSLSILNWNGDVTLNNIVITGTTGTNGLQVFTTKNIVLNNVQSNGNAGRGALLQNDSGVGNITITNSQFNGNGTTDGEGLRAESKGIITLKDVTASSNGGANGYGAYLYNRFSATPKAITLSGTNTFNGNNMDGLYIASDGAITLNNIIASSNSGYGAQLYNNFNVAIPSGITLTGTNTFTDNNAIGLSITSFGAVKISNLFANSNTDSGVIIKNEQGNTAQPVTLTGTNEFKYNGFAGLVIWSKGQINLNNISANSNAGFHGVDLDNRFGSAALGVTLTGTNSFSQNFNNGLNIKSFGTILLNAITADGNGTGGGGTGASIENGSSVSLKNVTITGFNSFSDNYTTGLRIITSGVITLNNIKASSNNSGVGGNGAELNNTLSGSSVPKAITLAGTNEFNTNSGHGLTISSYGAVTTNNITANNNGGDGANIINNLAGSPQAVTLNGTNQFNDNADHGLYVISKGAIRTNAVTANNASVGQGVVLDNGGTGAVGGVTMTGTNLFTGNKLTNLSITSRGAITLNSVTANSSITANGASLTNTYSSSAAVTMTGTNSFNSNSTNGLLVYSNGAITVSNLTASDNGNTGGIDGAYLDNSGSTSKAGVTVSGVNSFVGNVNGNGLQVYSLGNVIIGSVTASSNTGNGLYINNAFTGGIGSVTLSGTNIFNANAATNLNITSHGAISLSNVNSTNATGVGSGAFLDNCHYLVSACTAPSKPVTLSGTNSFSGNANSGLYINSNGAITLSNVTAENNIYRGADIYNVNATSAVGVTLTGTNKFNSNQDTGLYIQSKGLISVSNLTANTSTTDNGARLNNNSNGSTAGVTLTGFNSFDHNAINGLNVNTNGVITISNLTATYSAGGAGAVLNNLGSPSNATTPKGVTLSGTNTFSNNQTDGLVIDTYGSVLINNLTANNNGSFLHPGRGVDIDNNHIGAVIAANVTLTGANTFTGNYLNGLYVFSFGSISISNLTATNNSSFGAQLVNNGALSNAFGVTITGVNKFTNNVAYGLFIQSKGAVTVSSVTATSHNNTGVFIDNTFAGNTAPKPVTLSGVNEFTGNYNGLTIVSNGLVTISSINASNNTGNWGVSVNNSTAAAATPAGVNFTGTNTFNNNTAGSGLILNSKGKITLNNITANHNGIYGLSVTNNGVALTSGVIITGYGIFNTNSDNGANITSTGAVNLTKITGDSNLKSGLVVTTTSTVTLTCGSFNMNAWYGWEVHNATTATMIGVFTAGNTLGSFDNAGVPTVFVRACPLP
ncbi:MAG: hypothetical protein U0Z26_00800 [Anaerolineales bacterium]